MAPINRSEPCMDLLQCSNPRQLHDYHSELESAEPVDSQEEAFFSGLADTLMWTVKPLEHTAFAVDTPLISCPLQCTFSQTVLGVARYGG